MFDNLDDPRVQAQLAMAFGLLGGRGKGVGATIENIGQAGLLGLNRYALANEDKRRSGLVEDQRKMQAMQLEQLTRAQKTAEARQAAFQGMPDFSRPTLPDMAPTVENAAALAAAPRPSQRDVYQKRAEYLEGKGLFEDADKYRAKTVQKVKEVRTVMDGGQPKDLVIFDDGTDKLLPYGHAAKLELTDLGGTKAGVNPYTGSVQTTYAKSQTPDSIASNAITLRGQNLADARARDANAVASGNKLADIAQGLRKEFATLPEVKKYKEVIPVVEAARNAPDTPAGDFALIYGVGKALDPESVVREGEMNMVMKAGSPAQRVMGYLNHLRGKGRLTPQMRAELVQVLDQRAGEYANQYEAQKTTYGGIAEKSGVSPDQVFTDIPSGSIKPTAKPVKIGGKSHSAKLAPDGKFYVKLGEKYYEVTE